MIKTHFGIIGTGKIVGTILEAAKLESRFEAAAVYSRTQQNADRFIREHNIGQGFTDLEKMLCSDIDAVYIASPTSCHFEQSMLAMSYGKHVLCEKPLASNAAEAKKMIKASKKYNVTLMEAMRTPLEPNFKIIMQRLYDIGKIRQYTASYCQYSSRYDNFKKGIIENAFKTEFSNGATMDIGIYTIYPMVVLFGKPNKIRALGTVLHTGVDGQANVLFEYDNGMIASVNYSKITTSYLPFEIQGENGNIISSKSYNFDQLKLISKETEVIIGGEQLNTYYYELEEFIDLIEHKERESKLVNHLNSYHSLEILDEIRKQLGVHFPADR